MRLLVVGFADSVHIARYMQLLEGTGWDLHLFNSRPGGVPHPELPAVTLHFSEHLDLPESSPVRFGVVPDRRPHTFDDHVDHLARVVHEIRPDIIHSHEIQAGAAVVDALRRREDVPRLPWLVTSWGSDLTWWGRDPSHIGRIRAVLSACDYFSADCHRDVALARAFGFRGRVVGVWPVTAGIDRHHVASLRRPGPVSARRSIAVKGAVSAVGRGDVAFAAIERCADLLRGWEVGVYQLKDDLRHRYATLAAEAGFTFTALSGRDAQQSTHDDILAMHGRSRVSLALNLTDGLSVSFLEAMALGSFPIHGASSCVSELVPCNRGAFLVSPSDPGQAADALRRALTDDHLVDRAADVNARIVTEHLDLRRNRARVVDAYERILADTLPLAAA